MLRLLIDSLVAVMLAGVLASVVWYNRQQGDDELRVEATRQAIRAVQQQLSLQVALEKVELNDSGWPRTIDPDWFIPELPRNMVLEGDRPWLEVAGIEDRDRLDPPSITVADDSVASFWYNPYRGVVRARVPAGLTDATALQLYNQVNGTQRSTVVPAWNE